MWDRSLRFCVTGRSNNILSSVILGFDENTNWENAIRPRGVDWDGNDSDVGARDAQVVEITNDMAITKWVGLKDRPKDDLDVHYSPGTRIVIRREPSHPGAQQRMFDTNGWRHTMIICDLPDASPLDIDRLQREHAHVEENVKRLQTTGFDRCTFPDTARNKVWTSMVGWAHTLCRSNTPTPKSCGVVSSAPPRFSASATAKPGRSGPKTGYGTHTSEPQDNASARLTRPHPSGSDSQPPRATSSPARNTRPGYFNDPNRQPEGPSGPPKSQRQHADPPRATHHTPNQQRSHSNSLQTATS